MDAGVHLPQIEFAGQEVPLRRLADAVDAARENGFAAVSVNDHFLFGAPWLDGLTALAAVAERSGPMTLATTVSLAALRGPVPLAKALATLDILSGGRVLAGVGPGSSRSDYDALGVDFDSRWQRFEESVTLLRALLSGSVPPAGRRYFAVPEARLLPVPRHAGSVPLWIGSWGSAAGLRRVARLGDGWLASAYTRRFPGREAIAIRAAGRARQGSRSVPERARDDVDLDHPRRPRGRSRAARGPAPLLRRDPDSLGDQLCVGPAAHCAELLSRYAEAGCERVYLWPLGDEPRQVE